MSLKGTFPIKTIDSDSAELNSPCNVLHGGKIKNSDNKPDTQLLAQRSVTGNLDGMQVTAISFISPPVTREKQL